MGPGYDTRGMLAEMFEHAPDAMFLLRVTPDSRLVYESVNPAWERATGVSASKAVGHTPEELFPPDVARHLNASRRRCLEEGEPATIEENLFFPGGHRHWQTHLSPISRELLAGFARDITPRKRVEDALRDAEERWRTLAQSAPIYIFTLDRRGRFLSLNRGGRGLNAERLIGVAVTDLCEPEFRGEVERGIRGVFRRRRAKRTEVRARWPGRGVSWFDCTLAPLVRDGEVTAAIGTAIDITKRKNAEQAVAERERRFRALVENSWDGVTLVDAGGNILFTTPAMTRGLGYQPDEFVGQPAARFLHPDDAPRVLKLLAELVAMPGGRVTAKFRMRAKDGSWRWREGSGANLLHEPSVRAVVVNFHDITDRQRWEDATRTLEAGVSGVTGRAFFESLVRLLCEILGMVHARVVEFPEPARARTVAVWHEGRLAADSEYDVGGTPCERVIAEGVYCVPQDVRRRFPDAAPFAELGAESYLGIPLRDSNGVIIGFIALIDRKPLEDPSFAESLLRVVAPRVSAELERVRAEQELRGSEQRLHAVIEQAPVILWTTDNEMRITSTVGAGLAPLGMAPGATVGRRLGEILPPGHPGLEHHQCALDGGRVTIAETEWRGRRYESVVQPFRDQEGRVAGCLGVAVDITERKELQDQLRQAQKMEAVGRLAGGVAHDFNNLLTVISGYSSFLLESLPEGSSLRAYAEQVSQAATRAAQLTAQLLAFGRKQMLQPRVLDVNTLVRDAETMLRRLIGEDVVLVTSLQPRIGCVLADPGQVYQVVLNLVVNARDAMPRGGQIAISTANVTIGEDEATHQMEMKPGEYVLLAVSDTGHGMSRETLAHMFEPFFTTKEVGKGTGLGLSTAYGIVKQSGGHIAVESEPGRGSTFRVYLPRAEGQTDRETAVETERARGSETVLLVEDDELVRQFARSALEQAGYRVIEAANGQEAVRRLQNGTHVDLVLTDIVMPEMGGRELGEHVGRLRPGVPVVYLSGYDEEAIPREEAVSSGAVFLRKPFKAHDLAARVRETLDKRAA